MTPSLPPPSKAPPLSHRTPAYTDSFIKGDILHFGSTTNAFILLSIESHTMFTDLHDAFNVVSSVPTYNAPLLTVKMSPLVSSDARVRAWRCG